MTKNEMLKVENNYTVYMHKNKINGKVYIGITSLKTWRRWDCGRGYKNQILFYRAIEKYNWNNFEHIILYEKLTKEEAEQKEIELIAYYKSNNKKYGYNIANGGNSIGSASEETRKKMSERMKKNNPMKNKETVEKMRQSQLGKKLSEEHKQKLINANKGRKRTEEEKEKNRVAHLGEKNGMYGRRGKNHPSYGKHLTEETKQKISKKSKGHIAPNKGKKLTNEEKVKISIATKKAMQTPEIKVKLCKPKTIINKSKWKKVICIETNEIFESITLASKNKNCKSGDISRVCKGKSKTCGGYHWKYYEE